LTYRPPTLADLRAAQAGAPHSQSDAFPPLAQYTRRIEALRRRVAAVAASLHNTNERLDFLQTALTEFAQRQHAESQRVVMNMSDMGAGAGGGDVGSAEPKPLSGDAAATASDEK
jgi:hypothetical protein